MVSAPSPTPEGSRVATAPPSAAAATNPNHALPQGSSGRHAAPQLRPPLPVKMVIPMALFMLPALFVMIFGPVAAEMLNK